MRLLLRRIVACAILFCINPRAFLRAAGRWDSSRGRTLRQLWKDSSK